jgi:DNA-binding YbaB/EbfC family protein
MFEGLKNLGNIASMLKQAQEVGGKLQAIRDEIRTRRVTGSAGAGLLTVEANGDLELVSCQIDPSLLKPEDREMLEDLLVAAANQALERAKALQIDAIKSVTGGLPVPPGLGDLLGNSMGS